LINKNHENPFCGIEALSEPLPLGLHKLSALSVFSVFSV